MEDGRRQQLQWSWHACILHMAADAHISGGGMVEVSQQSSSILDP